MPPIALNNAALLVVGAGIMGAGIAQVAAQADHQVGVRKVEDDGRTRAEVAVRGADDRVVEISRMLSGSPDSEAARRHARELLGDRAGRGPARG